jgi:hypothetical protein
MSDEMKADDVRAVVREHVFHRTPDFRISRNSSAVLATSDRGVVVEASRLTYQDRLAAVSEIPLRLRICGTLPEPSQGARLTLVLQNASGDAPLSG